MSRCTTELIAFTDDDCRVERDWLSPLVEELGGDQRCGLAFGQVIPAPCLPSAGFIVGYEMKRARVLKGRRGKLRDGGIGANMLVRLACARSLGGFDELLGPGARFYNCEDGDFAYRVLSHGWTLRHVPGSHVTHYGLRDWAGGREFARRTYVGIGAAYFKHVRCGDAFGLLLFAQQCGMAAGQVLKNLVCFRRPIGLVRLLALFQGLRRSFERRVERRTALYI
jgi:GT2 family glycosyltransferase